MAAASYKDLPVVDYLDVARNKPKFLKDLRRALADIGFLVLANAPGLDDEFQQRMFKEARAFFDSPYEVKKEAGIVKSPYFRGYSKKTPGDSGGAQVIEAFQYGFDNAPLAAYDDRSVPLWKRVFRGPNTWPEEKDLPGFKPAVNELCSTYHHLTHELGHLILECLDEDPAQFDQYFNFEDPELAASLNHNFGIEHIAPHLREKVAQEYAKHKSLLTGSHIDGPPFIALLINDKPGLQVVAGEGKWINAPVTCRTSPGEYPVPVIPGAVIVNAGGTLMHLSKGRVVATLHRVNTLLIPPGEDRISLPYFLLPNMEGSLVPFGDAADDTGYDSSRDRGTNACVNRMNLFRQVTKQWWAEEFEELQAQWQKEVQAETEKAYELAARRGERNQAIAAAKL
jgi:isopenicillin N synthase-like dioxygenase